MTDTPYAAIQRSLAAGETILIDGATGTELEHRGAAMHERAWCAMATLTHPEVLLEVHRDYISAGARVITTNTFSTNRNMMEPAGLGDRCEEANRRAVEIALEARERSGAGSRVAVAGSMSHQVPVVRGAARREPGAVPPHEVAVANFREMAGILASGGVDFIIMEMMSDPELAVPALEAARATGLPVWVGYCAKRADGGDLRCYSRPELSAREMFAAIDPGDAHAAGIMHSNVNLVIDALTELRETWDGPLMAYPDSGYFQMPNWQFVDIISPADLAARTLEWVDAGARIVGGCCGLGLAHTEAQAEALARRGAGA